MYDDYFHLTDVPFQLTSDHRYFFGSSGHKRAIDYLRFGLSQGEGIIVITGDVGAGKTTLVAQLLSTLDPAKFAIAIVVTTQVSGNDLIRLVAENFGVTQDGLDKAGVVAGLHKHILMTAARGSRAIVIVDEAQNLSLSALEELRMLTNLQGDRRPSIQLILVGQPELRGKMATPELAQLRQRVITTCHLGPMSAAETGEYIRHRLTRAGWDRHPVITNEAYTAAYLSTGGIPRVINLLFSRILLYMFLEKRHVIDAYVVQIVSDDLQVELEGHGLRPNATSPSQPLACTDVA